MDLDIDMDLDLKLKNGSMFFCLLISHVQQHDFVCDMDMVRSMIYASW